MFVIWQNIQSLLKSQEFKTFKGLDVITGQYLEYHVKFYEWFYHLKLPDVYYLFSLGKVFSVKVDFVWLLDSAETW